MVERIELPDCEKGLGHIILSPASDHLIAGVRIEKIDLWPDDRGFFLEIGRMGTSLIDDFPGGSTQISAALSYPGTIKAFHFHLQQTDCWVPANGMFQVALVDLRPGSETFGRRNTMYVGSLRPWRIRIPPGVGHGYKVLGTEPAMLVYITDRFYDPNDEGRIEYCDPGINYNWEIQHK